MLVVNSFAPIVMQASPAGADGAREAIAADRGARSATSTSIPSPGIEIRLARAVVLVAGRRPLDLHLASTRSK